jgi:hypothetical protein
MIFIDMIGQREDTINVTLSGPDHETIVHSDTPVRALPGEGERRFLRCVNSGYINITTFSEI